MRKRFYLSLCGFMTLVFGLFIAFGVFATQPISEFRLFCYGFVSGFMITTTIYIIVFDRAIRKAETRNNFWTEYQKRRQNEKD